mmetsp:Transcript_7787/g.18542  ORF Transcript_7787/g.18542 Transcript_7787/m.18542 type:complete len:222 (+) Transcript_7787:38-703(+)
MSEQRATDRKERWGSDERRTRRVIPAKWVTTILPMKSREALTPSRSACACGRRWWSTGAGVSSRIWPCRATSLRSLSAARSLKTASRCPPYGSTSTLTAAKSMSCRLPTPSSPTSVGSQHCCATPTSSSIWSKRTLQAVKRPQRRHLSLQHLVWRGHCRGGRRLNAISRHNPRRYPRKPSMSWSCSQPCSLPTARCACSLKMAAVCCSSSTRRRTRPRGVC